jgi:hypothetical protein
MLLAAGLSAARPPEREASGGLATLSVPGGTAALARAAGVEASTPRGILLLQVVRAMHEAPAGSDPVRDERIRRFQSYLADVAGFLAASRAFPGGRLTPAQARSRDARRGLEDLASAIGADLADQGGAGRLAVREDASARQKQRHLEAAGVRVAALVADLNAGRDVSLAMPADEVPLPLDAGAWVRLVGAADPHPGSLLPALVSDRRASLLYYGLMGLDGPTRAWVAANPSLLEGLLKGNRPALFASLGRSIRVRAGSIDVPGGPAAVAAWEALVRERAAAPAPFILALLDREAGRAALLYDAVDHLDPVRQAFALGANAPDLASRTDHLRALLAACLPSLAGWDPQVRPFRRVLFDPVHLLAVTSVLPSGEPSNPGGRRFWSAVLAAPDVPSDPGAMIGAGAPDAGIDAVWLVQQLCVPDPVRRQQLFRVWLFGQRVFAGVSPAALPQALVALRGAARFPTLLLTLERMGVSDPAVCASAVRHAQLLSDIGDRETATRSLSQFQGALAVLDRISVSRALSPDVVTRLVGSLAAVPPSSSGDYQGGIARWFEAQLLPALPQLPGARAAAAGTVVSAEATLLAAMAGVGVGPASPDVEWEGLPYRVDVGASEFARLVAVREKQGGHSLDAVLALCRETRRLRSAVTSPSDVPARVDALTAAIEALVQVPRSLFDEPDRHADLRKLADEAADDLRKIRTAKDLPKIDRIAGPLDRAGDALLARVLASLAYAAPLGDPAGPELLAGDPAARHDFGLDERTRDARTVNPWRVPKSAVGVAGGWRVSGAMLGLDVGLAALALRRLEADGLPPPPGGNDIDRATLAAAVSLHNRCAATDVGRDTLTDAIRRGRARLAGVIAHPSALPELVRAARHNEWRRQVIPWAQAHEPERLPDYFSLADLVRISEAETTPLPPLAAWGTARLDTEGCFCLRYPDVALRDTLAGRMGTGLVVEQFADLQLRVAEALSDLALPAQLARAVLALATQDVLDAYRPAYIDDWSAMVAAVRGLSDSRFVDYVAALTAGGPLVPDDRERTDDAGR